MDEGRGFTYQVEVERAWELSGEIGEDGRKAYPASRKEMEMKLSHHIFACLNGLG